MEIKYLRWQLTVTLHQILSVNLIIKSKCPKLACWPPTILGHHITKHNVENYCLKLELLELSYNLLLVNWASTNNGNRGSQSLSLLTSIIFAIYCYLFISSASLLSDRSYHYLLTLSWVEEGGNFNAGLVWSGLGWIYYLVCICRVECWML